MVAALELYLDTVATRRIRVLWDALEAEGVQSLRSLLEQRHRPHVSLAVAPRFDPQRVAAALEGTTVAAPLRLSFQYVGQFVGRVLWLGLAPTVELLEHHRRVHDRLTAAGIPLTEHYRPGNWIPHCTLSMRVPNTLLTPAIRRCLEILPLEATITSAALTDHARNISHPLP
ncbi:2'-5' RNA ligase family protein [Micromonospora sp. NPDC048871]|uniref:2'-5' RNA ligase family protein n=1 Tax=unclassified Micromonospora TaxID=2617518 RepID=UPI002E0DF449|nr:2'-5' RNA ligase family protein [Micromonospora sp. NBC_01739]